MRAAAVMRVRQFRLLVAGVMTQEAADVLFGRADDLCVEALPSGGSLPVVPSLPSGGGGEAGWVAWVAFDRPAPTLIDAVVSGVRDLDAAGLGIAAAIADDSLVTAEIIAERVDRPAGVVRGWALPEPVGPHPRRPVFDWGEIVEWLGSPGGGSPDDGSPGGGSPGRPSSGSGRPSSGSGRPSSGSGRPWTGSVDEEAALEAVSLTLRVRALGPRLERMTPLRSLL